MQRRSFVQLIGATTLTASAEPAKPPALYLLEQYFLKNGTQAARLAEFLQAGRMEAASRLQAPAPRIVLDALIAPHMPQVAVVTPCSSLEELREGRARLAADSKYKAALAQWEAPEEAPYESYTESVLEATPYAPALEQGPPSAAPLRVFELRVYHSPTERQLAALHERFAGPEVQIFHRCGIHPVLYSSTLIGSLKPNLVYLTPFADLAAREKAWAAFGADPQWVKVRAESIAKHGQISSVIQIALFKAAAYSPIR